MIRRSARLSLTTERTISGTVPPSTRTSVPGCGESFNRLLILACASSRALRISVAGKCVSR